MNLDNREEVIKACIEQCEYWIIPFERLKEKDKDRIEELMLYQWFKLRCAFSELGINISEALKEYKKSK